MICEICDTDYEMWMTTDEEWNRVSENVYSYWCISCFKNMANEGGIVIDENKIEIYNLTNPYNK